MRKRARTIGRTSRFTVVVTCWLYSQFLFAAEPSLPTGLGAEPGLPAGLDEPALPAGITTMAQPAARSTPTVGADIGNLSGFAEFRGGVRTGEDNLQEDNSILEARVQLDWERNWDSVTLSLTADLLHDAVARSESPDLENGAGWLDLREAAVLLRPWDSVDIKLGRQILTWGTGDLLFINDLFPKDWNAFFIGRDDEYLKGPSDALKLAWFNDLLNIDVVYTPRFDADRFIDGQRISWYNPALGRITGQDFPVHALRPDNWFSDDETAVRLYRNFGSWETALYGYEGFWKSPGGQDPAFNAIFPALRVLGGSVRGPWQKGIGQVEFGYYDSRDDSSGENPMVNNSEWRFLLGYEQELVPQLTGSVQWYLERMQDHRAYLRTLLPGINARDQSRQVITVRLTRQLLNQNLSLSLFTYYSPTDDDGYVRAKANYKFTDEWQFESGANIFKGRRQDTFFGQFEDASNIYVAVRYGF